MNGSMKNYYEILGIDEEATQEEIRARWDELTKLYHPDVLQSPEADDRIKEINEAYQVLKDYSTRLEYDLERALRRSILKKSEERKRRSVRLQKILLPISLAAILFVIGAFVFFSKSPQVFQGPIKVTVPETARVVEPEVPKKLDLRKEADKLKEPDKPKKPEKPVEVAKVVPREPVKVVTPEPPKVVEHKKPVEVAKVLPREAVKVVVPEPTIVVEPKKPEEPKKLEKPKEPEKPTPSREEEVKKFFAGYIDRYNYKDAEGFLSFFSSRAIQNQKDGMDGIRKIYANFFNKSQELRYQIKDIQVNPYLNGLEVKARYELNQISKEGGEKKVWRGQARWVLVKEDGVLKILSLDYQHQK